MKDKTSVDDIIGLVKTDEVTNSVEEVRKLRGRAREYQNDFRCSDCKWEQSTVSMDKEGNESIEWIPVDITAVPVGWLLREYEDLVFELSEKEVELYNLKEAYLIAEAKIVNETDFKAIYNKNNADIRKQHVKKELSDMYEQIKSLEFSIAFIGRYIGLLKEVVRTKQ